MPNIESRPAFVIEASQIHKNYFKDLLSFHELLLFFAWRDLIVRYKQAFFGIAWALLRPLLNMAVFTFLFSKIAHFPSEHISYPLFVLAAMLPWQLFANTVVDGCSSLVTNAPLITKVYFPRMLIPISQLLVHYVEFAITGGLLLSLGIFLGQISFINLLFFPVSILLVTLFSLAISFWLSALTVKYRDFRIIVPFLVQFGMFISPVGYGSFIVPESVAWIFFLNPMVGIIDSFRWTFFGITYTHMWEAICISTFSTLILLISGYRYFRNTERDFADTI